MHDTKCIELQAIYNALESSPSKARSVHPICPVWALGLGLQPLYPKGMGCKELPPSHTHPVQPPEAAVPVLDSLPVLLLLPELSPRLSTEMPLKLLALVTAGFRLRRELSESVLLQGRGSVSVLLWWLLADLPDASLLILQVTNSTFSTGSNCKVREKKKNPQNNKKKKEKVNACRIL